MFEILTFIETSIKEMNMLEVSGLTVAVMFTGIVMIGVANAVESLHKKK